MGKKKAEIFTGFKIIAAPFINSLKTSFSVNKNIYQRINIWAMCYLVNQIFFGNLTSANWLFGILIIQFICIVSHASGLRQV